MTLRRSGWLLAMAGTLSGCFWLLELEDPSPDVIASDASGGGGDEVGGMTPETATAPSATSGTMTTATPSDVTSVGADATSNDASDASDITAVVTSDFTTAPDETSSGGLPAGESTDGSSEDGGNAFVSFELETLVCTPSFTWTNTDAVGVPCDTADGDGRGVVALASSERPFVMDRVEYTSDAFVTRPNTVGFGQGISGLNQSGTLVLTGNDVFRARIGCVDGYPGCDVTVRVTARLESDPLVSRTDDWRVRADDEESQSINLTLNDLGAVAIRLELAIDAFDNPAQSFLLWVDPRIECPDF